MRQPAPQNYSDAYGQLQHRGNAYPPANNGYPGGGHGPRRGGIQYAHPQQQMLLGGRGGGGGQYYNGYGNGYNQPRY